MITEALDGPTGWIYFGKSEDAFDDSTAYLGAFNGHVNGTCMMKEIHEQVNDAVFSGKNLTFEGLGCTGNHRK